MRWAGRRFARRRIAHRATLPEGRRDRESDVRAWRAVAHTTHPPSPFARSRCARWALRQGSPRRASRPTAVAAGGRRAHAAVASTCFLLLTPLGTQWPWLLGGGGEKGSTSHRRGPAVVSPDLASLLFSSPAGCFRRALCAPELSPAALAAQPVGGHKGQIPHPAPAVGKHPSRPLH